MSQDVMLDGVAISSAESEGPESQHSVCFRIVGELGHGGMGIVYRAQQQYPRRIVALKVLKRSVADVHSKKRFAREIHITAQLTHRGIAQLFFAGLLKDGQPFMAMEFVDGQPLTVFARDHRLSTRDRLLLFLKVCDIVAYAHGQNIVHRDLKPSNILVEPSGEPKILDFGLATGPLDTQTTQLTMQGQLVGTLDYMSPEQAEGNGQEVDRQSDVYALGVILYELLTKHRPLDLSSVTLVDAVRVIRDSMPRKLSELDRTFRGDLETIVHKALAKEKSKRFATVEELSGDLRRWMAHEPIHSRPPSAAYLARRYVQRHRLLLGSAGLIILALSIGLVLAARQTIRANKEAARANEQTRLTQDALVKAQINQAHVELLYANQLAAGGNGAEAMTHYDAAWTLLEQNHQSTLEVRTRVWQLDQAFAREIGMLEANAEGVQQLALSRDQKHLAIAYGDGRVEIRDPLRNEKQWSFQTTAPVAVTFSPDGANIMTSDANAVEVRSMATHTRLFTQSNRRLSDGQMAVNGDQIAYLTEDQKLHVERLNVAGSAREWPLQAAVKALAFQTNQVLVVDANWHVWRIALDSGKSDDLGSVAGARFGSAAFSHDARHFAVLNGGQVIIYQVDSMKETGRISGCKDPGPIGFSNSDTVYAVTADGTRVLLCSTEGQVQRAISLRSAGPMASVGGLAVVKDGSRLGEWSIMPLPECRILVSATSRPHAAALSSDGDIAAVADASGNVTLVDTAAGHTLCSLPIGGAAKSLRFDRTTESLAVQTEDHRILVFDLGKPGRCEVLARESMQGFGYAGRGDLLAFGNSKAHQLEILRRTASGWSSAIATIAGSISRIEISSDSQEAAIFFLDGSCGLWDLTGPVPLKMPGMVSVRKWDIEDLAARNHGQSLKAWNLKSGELRTVNDLGFIRGILGEPDTSGSAELAAPSGGDVFLQDLNSLDSGSRIPSPLTSVLELYLSHDGGKLLLSSHSGVAALDLGRPAALRLLQKSHPAELPWQSSDLNRWLLSLGLWRQAVDTKATAVGKKVDMNEGFALWESGRYAEAYTLFQNAGDMTPGSKRMLLTALQEAIASGAH